MIGSPIFSRVGVVVAPIVVGNQTRGAIEDAQIGIIEMLGEPVTINEKVTVRSIGP